MTKQQAADALADILWFLKGAMTTNMSFNDFSYGHLEALRIAREELLKGATDEAN